MHATSPEQNPAQPTAGQPTSSKYWLDFDDPESYVSEDGEPVESVFIAVQYRVLVDALYRHWKAPVGRRFLAAANIGLFPARNVDPLIPDFLLALDMPEDFGPNRRRDRSYLVHRMGRPPTMVVEFVSDGRGEEYDEKLDRYQGMRVPYYVVHDPELHLKREAFAAFALRGDIYVRVPPIFPDLGLGLMEWRGTIDGATGVFLRWIDATGAMLPTGAESLEQLRWEASEARRQTDREKLAVLAAAKLAADEKQRADDEKRRADDLAAELARLKATLSGG